jgi:hypothetical protein
MPSRTLGTLPVLSALFLLACTAHGRASTGTGTTSTTSTAATGGAGSGGGSGGAGGGNASCSPAPAPSHCKNASSWIRGTASFDPTHYAAGAHPVLRLALRHSWIIIGGEEKIGGRLHAYQSFPVTDVASGHVSFALDMCLFGEAMWSEENGAFHLVGIMDENGNNNLDDATSNETAITIGTPDAGELVGMVDVDLSCNAPSPCVSLPLNCTAGASCTTIQPIASCSLQTPACNSAQSFCK